MTEREIVEAIDRAFAGIGRVDNDLDGFIVANSSRTAGIAINVTTMDPDEVIACRIENAKQTFINGLEKGPS